MKNDIKSYFASGTEAFSEILKELNLKKGSEIIVPVTLCKSMINEIIHSELSPVFCDVDNSFIIKNIEEKITENTKMIVFVEQYGFIIDNKKIYFNKKNEKIIKILDSCQSNIKTNYNYDYVIYSFNKNKPISLGKYSMIKSKNKVFNSIKLPVTIKIKLTFEYCLYYIKLIRKFQIKKNIEKKLKIDGYFVKRKNKSLHRIVFVMDISREEYEYFDECLYKYLDENNLDIVQTTLEVNPYEELNIKESFNNFNKLRYKTLYFRSSGKVKDYKKTIEFMNGVYDYVKNKFK